MRDIDITNALTLAGVIVGVLTGHVGIVMGAILFWFIAYVDARRQR